MPAEAFQPKYARGDNVVYRDHHDRIQEGRVRSIEVHYSSWGSDPYAIYTVGHPTYHNKKMYVGDDDVLRLSETADPLAGRDHE